MQFAFGMAWPGIALLTGTRLRGFRLRFASMLPALIGLRTIQLLRQRPEGERVKVPRRTVYACMLQAVWLSSVQRAS